MDRQRFFEILCHGLTLCIDEIAKELTAGLVAESERPSVTKCLAELRDTQAKLWQAQPAPRSLSIRRFGTTSMMRCTRSKTYRPVLPALTS